MKALKVAINICKTEHKEKYQVYKKEIQKLGLSFVPLALQSLFLFISIFSFLLLGHVFKKSSNMKEFFVFMAISGAVWLFKIMLLDIGAVVDQIREKNRSFEVNIKEKIEFTARRAVEIQEQKPAAT